MPAATNSRLPRTAEERDLWRRQRVGDFRAGRLSSGWEEVGHAEGRDERVVPGRLRKKHPSILGRSPHDVVATGGGVGPRCPGRHHVTAACLANVRPRLGVVVAGSQLRLGWEPNHRLMVPGCGRRVVSVCCRAGPTGSRRDVRPKGCSGEHRNVAVRH